MFAGSVPYRHASSHRTDFFIRTRTVCDFLEPNSELIKLFISTSSFQAKWNVSGQSFWNIVIIVPIQSMNIKMFLHCVTQACGILKKWLTLSSAERIITGLLAVHYYTKLNSYLDVVHHTVMQDVLSLNLIGKYRTQPMDHAALQDITAEPPTIIAFALIALTSEQLSIVSFPAVRAWFFTST